MTEREAIESFFSVQHVGVPATQRDMFDAVRLYRRACGDAAARSLLASYGAREPRQVAPGYWAWLRDEAIALMKATD